MARLKQRVVERVLAGELTHHLGYGHGEKRGETTEGNRRATEIAVPQDRNGNFEPMLWLKEQKRFVGFDKRIIAMYGRGRRCAKSRESARNPKNDLHHRRHRKPAHAVPKGAQKSRLLPQRQDSADFSQPAIDCRQIEFRSVFLSPSALRLAVLKLPAASSLHRAAYVGLSRRGLRPDQRSLENSCDPSRLEHLRPRSNVARITPTFSASSSIVIAPCIPRFIALSSLRSLSSRLFFNPWHFPCPSSYPIGQFFVCLV